MLVRKFVEFFFFGSIFLGVCVVSLCIETNLLLHLPLNNLGFYLFVFGAVLVQYNLHYLIKASAPLNSMRFEWSKKNKNTHLILMSAGVLLILTGMLGFRLHHFIVLFILGIITLLYSLPVLPFANKKRIKDFGILKIITLVMLWSLITVWFPADGMKYTSNSFFLIFIGRFIFLFALCLVFDIRDMDIDTTENIRTIPVIIGVKKTYVVIYLLLGVFIFLTVVQYFRMPVIGPLNAMILSAGATFVMIAYTKKNKSDIAYLACIDGMMLLQALLVIIDSI
ncbi:MAG: UbiA family prenyltransferase [Ginsengibacter sp.]